MGIALARLRRGRTVTVVAAAAALAFAAPATAQTDPIADALRNYRGAGVGPAVLDSALAKPDVAEIHTVAAGLGMATASSLCSYFDISGTDVADSDYWYQHVNYTAVSNRNGGYFADARTIPGDNAVQVEIGAQADNIGDATVDGFTDVGMAFEVIPGGGGGGGPFRWQVDFGWQLNGGSAARAENLAGTILGTRLPFIPDNDAEGETRGSLYPTYANLTTGQVFTVPGQGATLHGARAGTELPWSDVSNNENFSGTASMTVDFGYNEPVAVLMTLDHFSKAIVGATSGGSASSISDFFDPNANISLHVAWMRVTSLSGLQFAC